MFCVFYISFITSWLMEMKGGNENARRGHLCERVHRSATAFNTSRESRHSASTTAIIDTHRIWCCTLPGCSDALYVSEHASASCCFLRCISCLHPQCKGGVSRVRLLVLNHSWQISRANQADRVNPRTFRYKSEGWGMGGAGERGGGAQQYSMGY